VKRGRIRNKQSKTACFENDRTRAPPDRKTVRTQSFKIRNSNKMAFSDSLSRMYHKVETFIGQSCKKLYAAFDYEKGCGS